MKLRNLSDHLFETLLNGYAPRSSLVCSIEGDEGEGGAGGDDGGLGDDDGGDDGDGDPTPDPTPDPNPTPDPSALTAEQLKEHPAFREIIERERAEARKAGANAKAAELRRQRKKKSNNTTPKPPPSDPEPDLESRFAEFEERLLGKVGETLETKLEGISAKAQEEKARAQYDAMMADYGVSPKLSKRLYDDYKSESPKDPESWVAKELEEMGAQVPKKLRKQAQLKAVGPKGVRDLEQVASIHDLTADEARAIGPRKLRLMYDKQQGRGAAGNPFARKKEA